jgi:hypothetical protein
MSFDTYGIVKKLKAAGFSELQAEAVTDAVRDSRDVDFSVLATKTDLAAVRADFNATTAALKADIEIIKIRLDRCVEKSDLEALRAEILKWIVGAVGLQTIAVIAAAIALSRTFH